ncbi:MAG: mycothiol conjugate amidase Mca [Acidimicrobiia bacterium]
MARTLLALHAHPDDESSKGAGTVSRYAAAGVRCVLVTATGGEAGDILNPEMERPEIAEDLRAVREAELAEAAAIQGYDDVILLGYRDSGMPGSAHNADPRAFCNQPIDDVLGRLVEIVRAERPDVLLGYDSHERYPHPDHLRIHELTVPLFEAAANPGRFPDVGSPWEIKKVYAPMIFTRERVLALHQAMLNRTGTSPYQQWLDHMDADRDPERRMTRVNVTGFIDQSRRALLAHRTQIDPQGPWFRVPTDVVEEVYPWEDFELLATRVAWEPDAEDLFAGIS